MVPKHISYLSQHLYSVSLVCLHGFPIYARSLNFEKFKGSVGMVAKDLESFEISDEKGVMIGGYRKSERKLYIWAVFSKQKGFLKESLNKLCGKYQTSDIEFTKIITPNLLMVLRGFVPIRVYDASMEEYRLDLVGRWVI